MQDGGRILNPISETNLKLHKIVILFHPANLIHSYADIDCVTYRIVSAKDLWKHRLDMTLAVPEALNPNKPNQKYEILMIA